MTECVYILSFLIVQLIQIRQIKEKCFMKKILTIIGALVAFGALFALTNKHGKKKGKK